MTTAPDSAAANLCSGILSDARQESERLVRNAEHEARDLLAQARAEADTARQECLGRARTEARRRAELVLATIPVETNRLRLARIEWLLDSIRAEAHRRLLTRQGFDYEETLIRIACAAIRQMGGESFILIVSPADRVEFAAGLKAEIPRRLDQRSLQLEISEDPALVGGGVLVRDTSGHRVWDGRLTARLQRLWPELRAHLTAETGLTTSNPSLTT
jgi:vacuolar-type H+-ATPase subunit E/Vma4